jgi:hypothetical protein
MKKVLLAIALAAGSGQVLAYSGNELLERARSGDRVQAGQATGADMVAGGTWLGFVRGVAYTLDDIDPKVCLPSNGTVGQYAAVVKQYLEQNPAQLHRPAQVLAREALQRAFPCR